MDPGAFGAHQAPPSDCPSNPLWIPLGNVASGVGNMSAKRIIFADPNGGGFDDYLVVDAAGRVTTYINVQDAGKDFLTWLR